MASSAGCLEYLNEAQRLMQELISKADEKEKTCARNFKAMKREIDELNKEKMKLEKECAELEIKTAEFDKKTSSSRDARKMYGDVAPGDTTHQDIIVSYQNHFQTAYRSLQKIYNPQTKEEKFKVWEKASDIVQQCFEQNKEAIISDMMMELGKSLETAPPSDRPLEDKTSDLYKAFGIYVKKLESNKLEELKKELIDEAVSKKSWKKDEATAIVNLAADIITELDPEDYYSFILEGKKHAKNYQKVAASSTDNSTRRRVEMEKKNKCAACKKSFSKDRGDNPTYHLGLYWHQRHSYCPSCHKLVDEKFKYFKSLNSTYCSHCLCVRCQEPLDDKAYVTEDGPYHYDCIACVYCRRIKEDIMIIKGNHVCRSCNKKNFTKR